MLEKKICIMLFGGGEGGINQSYLGKNVKKIFRTLCDKMPVVTN